MTTPISFVNCIDTINNIINYINYKKPGMYLRFGDGDFNLAENKDDMLANANYKLQELILNSMSIRDENIMICIPHHCRAINTLEDGMYPGNHEYPYDYIKHFLFILSSKTNNIPSTIYTNVALSYCSVYYPDVVVQLHKQLKENEILYVGNYIYSDKFLNNLFGDRVKRINTKHNNAFDDYERIFSELDNQFNETYSSTNYFIIIIAAGCASRGFASVIYEKYYKKHANFFLFDYGSLLDYFYGLNTRAYMDLMPPNKDYILNNI
jgi:hypothetical protein